MRFLSFSSRFPLQNFPHFSHFLLFFSFSHFLLDLSLVRAQGGTVVRLHRFLMFLIFFEFRLIFVFLTIEFVSLFVFFPLFSPPKRPLSHRFFDAFSGTSAGQPRNPVFRVKMYLFGALLGTQKNAQNAIHGFQEVKKGSEGAFLESFYALVDLLKAFGRLLDISLVVLGRQKCAGPRFWTLL